MKILVTGAQGFLGRHFVSRLQQKSYRVICYEQDVRTLERFEEIPDIVFHLAAKTHAHTPQEKRNLMSVAVQGTDAILRFCFRHNIPCWLASTAAVYQPQLEDHSIQESDPITPTTLYGKSKWIAEEMAQCHAQYLGVSITIFRIFNLYGPTQKKDFLIPYLYEALRSQSALGLKTPNLVRDFIHVYDVVEAMMCAVQNPQQGFQVFNVGTGVGHRVLDVARMVSKRLHKTLKIDENEIQTTAKNFMVADITRMKKTFGWRPKMTLQDGMEECGFQNFGT